MTMVSKATVRGRVLGEGSAPSCMECEAQLSLLLFAPLFSPAGHCDGIGPLDIFTRE